MQAEARLDDMGLVLPDRAKLPPGVTFPFAWARLRGNRLYVSGHSALNPDGSPAGTFGRVPSEVSLEAAQHAARATALVILSTLQRELGDLGRVSAWLMVQGMVNADPGYPQTTTVINGFSELILHLYGEEVGRHARTAVGMAALPLNNAVVIAAELEFE